MDDRFAVEMLLSPLPDGVGSDPRDGGSDTGGYLAIKDARGEARLAERDALASGDPDVEPLRAGLNDWHAVAGGANALLGGSAKDLQVAAWLCEAWLRIEGFAGLAAGFALMAGLIETYWDEGLHPQEDEDGVESRVAPLFGLFGRGETGTLLQPIKLLPLTDYGVPPVALWTVEAAQAQSAKADDPDVREEMAARRQERISGIDLAIARATPGYADAAIAGIEGALLALERLMTAVDARTEFGRFGSQVARPLEDALALLRISHGRGDAGEADADATVGEAEGDGVEAVSSDTTSSKSPGMTRQKALATLLDVAAFFDRNEPQSFVALALRDLVRRAEMPLDLLLAELLPDGEQRALFLMRAGIRASQPADDGYGY